MRTYEEIANKNNMPPQMKERYIAYMRMRWSDEEEIQCQTGYAQEWAERFLCGDEYSCSDGVGKEVLAEIDSGNFKGEGMIEKSLLKFGYIRKERIKLRLFEIMSEIEDEINSRLQYPNIGKKGCLRRIRNLYEEIK